MSWTPPAAGTGVVVLVLLVGLVWSVHVGLTWRRPGAAIGAGCFLVALVGFAAWKVLEGGVPDSVVWLVLAVLVLAGAAANVATWWRGRAETLS